MHRPKKDKDKEGEEREEGKGKSTPTCSDLHVQVGWVEHEIIVQGIQEQTFRGSRSPLTPGR